MSNDDQSASRLSQIGTGWTTLRQAHEASPADAALAQQRILQRYGRAIQRYLLAALRDPAAADDAYQEFALRFVRGDFRRADPQRGRFRDFLKTALYHLVVDAQRKQRRPVQSLDAADHEPVDHRPPETAEADREFLEAWRGELLAQAWEALAASQEATGKPLHTVLRLRVDHPELNSAELAERLTAQLGKPVSAEWVRKWLWLARPAFGEKLLDAVGQSLGPATPGPATLDELEQELVELGLRQHCCEALKQRRT